MVGLVDEFARVLHEECDYVREGENAERLAGLFEDDVTVHFPRVYWDRTSATVLTLERIRGIGFNRTSELDARGVNRHEIARRGITCYYEQIFMFGFYHGDPHPGNLFAMEDGRVAFTDFGRCGELTDRARGLVADLLVAIIDQNGQEAVDVLTEVSTGAMDVDIAGLKRDVTALITKYYDMRLHEVESKELLTEVMSLVGKRGLTLSSEFALLLTTLATIQALGTAIDPQFHFVESVQPFARRIVEEQFQPRTITRTLVSTMRGAMKAMQGLPDNLNRALKRVGDGDMRMTVRPEWLRPLHGASRAGGRPTRVRAGGLGVRTGILVVARADTDTVVARAHRRASRWCARPAWGSGSSCRSCSAGSGSAGRTRAAPSAPCARSAVGWRRAYSIATCAPVQYGGFVLSPQLQIACVAGSSISNAIGVMPDPW